MTEHGSSSIRETCRRCGESHVTHTHGTSGRSYAIVIDECAICKVRKAELDAADEYVSNLGRRSTD